MNQYSEIMHDIKKLGERQAEIKGLQVRIIEEIRRLETVTPTKPIDETAIRDKLPPPVLEAMSEEDRLREETLKEIDMVEKEIEQKREFQKEV